MMQTSICAHSLNWELQIILEYIEKNKLINLLMLSLTFSELESTRNIVKLAEATRSNIGMQVSVSELLGCYTKRLPR